MTTPKHLLTLFFDGACPLCAKEIEHYKKVDTNKQLKYIDISSSSFDAKLFNLDPILVNKEFHVRDIHNKDYTGVEAFALIWKELDIFRPLQRLYKFKPTSILMRCGYVFFSKLRPYLPKKKKCEDDKCSF